MQRGPEAGARRQKHPPKPSLTPAMEAPAGQQQQQQRGNELWEGLPAALVAGILQALGESVVQCSCTCRAWRAAVKGGLQSAAPKSVRAMPFLAGCTGLRRLQLGQAVPDAPFGSFRGFSRITSLTGLSALDLSISESAAWCGKAARLTGAELACISALTALQALDLSHQPLLQEAGALAALATLSQLRSLRVGLMGCSWQLPCSTWSDALAALTHLTLLGLAGCSQARVDTTGTDPDAPQQRRTGPSSSDDTTPAAAAAAAAGGGVEGQLVPAPLEQLSELVLLQDLDLSGWHVAPSAAGLQAIGRLTSLSSLDLSGCAALRQQRLSLPPLFSESPAASGSCSSNGGSRQEVAGPLFRGLRRLRCAGAQLALPGDCWVRQLPQLEQLDASSVSGFTAAGLAALQQLRVLVLRGCQGLDYDAMCAVMASCSSLESLDLQQATIIVQAGGSTGRRLQEGSYSSASAAAPTSSDTVAAAIAAARHDLCNLHSGSSSTAAATASSSRRDITAAPTGDASASTSGGEPGGLRVLLMSECGLAIEGFAWHRLPPGAPSDPSMLLLDMLLQHWQQRRRQQPQLQVLHWAHCSARLLQAVLSRLVAARLVELVLNGSNLPEDPSRCWAKLAAATSLTRLDLSDVGYSRRGFAHPCGSNPTVAVTSAVAGMRGLRVLGLAGWRFFFASLHPLAVLSGSLVALDLSHGRDVVDSTLWSLTHLTGLTRLSLAGCRPSNDALWALLFTHLSALRHLDLSSATNFTCRSAAALSLSGLTSLDLRGTAALLDNQNSVVAMLARLPRIRRLALTLQGAQQDGGGRGQLPRQQEAAAVAAQQAATGGVGGRAGGLGDDDDGDDGIGADARGCSGVDGCSCLLELGRSQSLRQLAIGAGPQVAAWARRGLPPWIDVLR